MTVIGKSTKDTHNKMRVQANVCICVHLCAFVYLFIYFAGADAGGVVVGGVIALI